MTVAKNSIPTGCFLHSKEYVLINQNEMHVEHFYKDERGQWIFKDYRDQEMFNLFSLDSSMAIADFYQNVDFEEME